MAGFMVPNERIPYRDSLAKYAAAFFRMSRSSVTRFSSDLRRRISAVCPVLPGVRFLATHIA